MNIANILIRPLVTEKSTSQLNDPSTYAFEVAVSADNRDIKAAVEAYYQVRVRDVRTLIVRGKSKRSGRRIGRRSNWKKAYVRLAAEDSINLFGS